DQGVLGKPAGDGGQLAGGDPGRQGGDLGGPFRGGARTRPAGREDQEQGGGDPAATPHGWGASVDHSQARRKFDTSPVHAGSGTSIANLPGAEDRLRRGGRAPARLPKERRNMKQSLIGPLAALSLVALLATACGTATGAAVGAGSGAAIGAGTGYGAGNGALIGTGVGAAAGAIYDIYRHTR